MIKFDECNRTEQNCLLIVEIKAAILSVIREPTDPPSSLISFSTSSLGRSSFEPRTNLNPFSESGRLAEDSVLKLYNPLENSYESTSNEILLFFFHDYFFGRITFHRSGKWGNHSLSLNILVLLPEKRLNNKLRLQMKKDYWRSSYRNECSSENWGGTLNGFLGGADVVFEHLVHPLTLPEQTYPTPLLIPTKVNRLSYWKYSEVMLWITCK